jgi:hypothetical protein
VHGKFPPMDSLILQEMEQMLTDINELKSIENSDKIDQQNIILGRKLE